MPSNESDALIDAMIFPGGVPSRAAEQSRNEEPEDDSAPAGWDARPIVRSLPSGEVVELFTVGQFAAALNRKPVTIRQWEDRGILPTSKYRTPAPSTASLPEKKAAGRRLYTREHVEAAISAAETAGVLDPYNAKGGNWKLFTKLVYDAWKSKNRSN